MSHKVKGDRPACVGGCGDDGTGHEFGAVRDPELLVDGGQGMREVPVA
ncbi:hypothetical protein ACWGEU_23335 [Streptomyces goshikiensis]